MLAFISMMRYNFDVAIRHILKQILCCYVDRHIESSKYECRNKNQTVDQQANNANEDGQKCIIIVCYYYEQK